MNPGLHEEIEATPEAKWELYSEDSRAIKEYAEIDYVPEESAQNRYREPLRYVATRIRNKQAELFADGSRVKHFAVISNLWDWPAKKLLQWHREKAGSIEAAHGVIKNELAGGVMPCGRFGANAAWLRLAVLTYNLLTALKRLALPPELLAARPQAPALSGFLHAGQTGASCAAHAAAAGARMAALFQLALRPAHAALAGVRRGDLSESRQNWKTNASAGKHNRGLSLRSFASAGACASALSESRKAHPTAPGHLPRPARSTQHGLLTLTDGLRSLLTPKCYFKAR
jgi:hypothetical protein